MTTEYTIDGSRIGSLEEFYDEISGVLIPGHRWGRNLDAFNDILKGGFGTPERIALRWRHSEKSRLNLGHPETARQLELQLAQCHPANRLNVEQKLADARAGIGCLSRTGPQPHNVSDTHRSHTHGADNKI